MDNLIVVTAPPHIPQFRNQLPQSILRFTFPFVSRLNYWYCRNYLKRALKQLSVQKSIVWLAGYGNYAVDAHRFFDDFENSLSCFQVYDEGPDFAHNKPVQKPLRDSDTLTAKKADVVITTSKSQFDRRENLNKNIFFMPNGVDFPMFNRALTDELPVPADIANIPKPIFGFSGWMGYQMDLELLGKIADSYPEASLVFLGPNDIEKSEKLSGLMAKKNVHFLGKKNREDLAAYFQKFDVAMIPYVMEGHTRFIYPLKLHEYLATGRSVVTTDLPNIYPHKELVHVTKTQDEFVKAIKIALDEYEPDQLAARVNLARQFSWDDRVEEIKQILEDHAQ
ncbi:MAG: glycosyltransferase [Chloroflexota bacterium]